MSHLKVICYSSQNLIKFIALNIILGVLEGNVVGKDTQTASLT